MAPGEIPFVEELTAYGEDAPSLAHKAHLLEAIRSHSKDMGHEVDLLLLRQAQGFHQGIVRTQAKQEKLKELLDQLGGTPWHPALFIRPVMTEAGLRALVMHGNSPRVVGPADGVDLASLRAGDEVLLGHELNVVVAKSPERMLSCGETASFERKTADGRLVLRWRDEEVVVDPAASLDGCELRRGDLLRWNRNAWMAFETIERSRGEHYFLKEVPDIGRDQVGGQAENLETLFSALTTTLVAPETARLYELGERQSIFMWGPPGCGKTLMARVVAAEIARQTGTRCYFSEAKPTEWEDPYVGVTQQNIRNRFAALEEASKRGFVVLFLDEIEAAGRTRGHAVGHHSDKFLNSLLTELDGFEQRQGVAVISASNRKDLIDPALLERLSGVEIRVGRPTMQGAEAIFGVHLPESLPFRANGSSAESMRAELIETAVSRFYSPNADNDLCVVRFRDGRTRTVAARELASGRVFEQICRQARQRAFLRHVRSGEPGLCAEDMESAVSQAMERLATTLTVRNINVHLADLPQDVDVVAVEPVVKRVRRPHRYLNVQVA